jgi:hypothetical protein
MARYAALYFGRTSPRPQPLADQRADLHQPYRIRSGGRESAKSLRKPLDSGVLVCEALRERSEQRTNKYPEVGGCAASKSRLKPLLQLSLIE